MQPTRLIKKVKARRASVCCFALMLALGCAVLWAQQVQPEAPPVQPQVEQSPGTPSQAPPAAAQSGSDQQPGTPPPARQQKSPLDDLDDLEPPAKASPPAPPAETESLHVLLGRPLVVTSPATITRFSVADPNIVDLVVLSHNQILVVGKQRGRVSLQVWDVTGQSQQFDINVECEPPAMPDQLLAALSGQPAPGEAPEHKSTWIYWVVVGSILLAGGIILGARRRRRPNFPNLGLQAPGSSAADTGQGVAAIAQPHESSTMSDSDEANTTDGPAGRNSVKVFPPVPKPGNAERNERLLDKYFDLDAKATPPVAQGPEPGDSSNASAAQKSSLLGTITALAFAVDAKGPYTTGHSQVVSRVAARIAIQAGLSVDEVEETRLAGLVHDIGKIHVPESVCNKPDQLTTEEFEVMSRHSAWGATMLEPLNVKTIESIVRHHHERFDGKGYPDRLAADKIPLGARIVAVAESFHSMLSDLPYKSARSFEDALAELRCCSGMQFDPKIVMAFLDWIQSYAASPERQKS